MWNAAKVLMCALSVLGREAGTLPPSVIVHEEWRLRHGMDESHAYNAQLRTLARLGRGPGTLAYDGVWRSMLAVLEVQRRSAGVADHGTQMNEETR